MVAWKRKQNWWPWLKVRDPHLRPSAVGAGSTLLCENVLKHYTIGCGLRCQNYPQYTGHRSHIVDGMAVFLQVLDVFWAEELQATSAPCLVELLLKGMWWWYIYMLLSSYRPLLPMGNTPYLQITSSDATRKGLSKVGRLGIRLGFKGHTPLYGYIYMEWNDITWLTNGTQCAEFSACLP